MHLLDYFMWRGKEGVSKNGVEKSEGSVTRCEFRLRVGNFWEFLFYFFLFPTQDSPWREVKR